MVAFEITDAHPYNVKTLTASVEFIITPVNDAPIITEKSDEVIEEDIPAIFAMELTDIDFGEVLTYRHPLALVTLLLRRTQMTAQ